MNLHEAAQLLGTFITRIDMGHETIHFIRGATTEQTDAMLYGIPRQAINVPVQTVANLPPWAIRFHWSDGRTVTRYRLVRHPTLIRVAVVGRFEAMPLTVATRTGAHGSWLPRSGEDAGHGPVGYSPWWPGRGDVADRWVDGYHFPRADR